MSEIWNKSRKFWTEEDRSAARYKAGLDDLTSTMLDNAKRVTNEVDSAIKTIRGIEQTQDRISDGLAKALNNQSNLIGQLRVSIDSLNSTLNAALGQSLDAMNAANETASRMGATFEKSASRMDGFAQQFQKGMDSFSAAGRTRRRLKRDKDGSWLVESD